MIGPIFQTYVYSKDKAWFVSTIERYYDCVYADGRIRGNETLIWEWDSNTGERGELMGRFGSEGNHFEICERLHRTGKIQEEE